MTILTQVLHVLSWLGAAVLLGGSVWAVGAQPDQPHPTLEDFWEGRAEWRIDVVNVGLPVGESDTLNRGDGVFWSYVHASTRSVGMVDQCGDPVAFPGCMARLESTDGGVSFAYTSRVCSLPCRSCPCTDQDDHTSTTESAQQYPRVAYDGERFYMAYEWHAHTILRTSEDGIVWSDWVYLRTPGGTFPSSFSPCSPTETIGAHPNIRGEIYDCLIGAPPGLYIEGDTLYVFVAAGSAPAHMRCYKGDKRGDLSKLSLCETDPLFGGARTYGDLDARGADANPYFDFRYLTSADVLKVGDRYYMTYEGIRGPEFLEAGKDTQYALGLARSTTDRIDGPWERYEGNPILQDVGFWVGIGHADLLVVDGQTWMYTQTTLNERGRYVLVWKDDMTE